MAQVTFETVELENFVKRLGKAAQSDFKRALNKFLEGLGMEFLRILQDEIVRRNVLDYRLLLHSFQKGDEENVWTLDENGLTLEVGTNVEYAKFVNDGHWTNPKGIERRFVPGHWEKANGKDRFIYTPGEKTGMVLKMKWVEGSHYWESSIRILEKLYPELLEKKLQSWLDEYFKDFCEVKPMAALEQEIASVIRFILDSVPGITPYYWDIPEGFVVPSVFFPQQELTPLGDTFASYAVEYDWYIRFFASTDEDAYASAAAALNALCAARLLVPLIDETGAAAGGGVRLKDPGGVKRLDTGTAQLTLHWDSRRPYNRVDCQKVMHYNLDLKAAEGKTE